MTAVARRHVEEEKPDLAALSVDVEEAITDAWEHDRYAKWAPAAHYASACGHPCLFYLWAKRTRWEEIPQPSTDLLGIFRNGREVEEAILSDLRDAGFETIKQQVGFEDADLQLRGRIDCFIRKPGHAILERARPCEVKSMHPAIYASVRTFADLADARRPWLRKYVGQLLSYLYLTNEPLGAMILRDKSSRATRVLWAWLDDWWAVLEAIGTRLATVNAHLKAGTEPEPLGYDPDLCDLCEVSALCPVMLQRQGSGRIENVNRPEIDALLTELADTAGAAKRHDAAERKVKATLEGAGYWTGDIGSEATLVTDRHRITCRIASRKVKEPPEGVELIERTSAVRKWEWVRLPADGGA